MIKLEDIENTETYKNLPEFLILEVDGIDIAVFKVDFENTGKLFKKRLIIKKIEYNYLTEKRPDDIKIFEKNIGNALKQILSEMNNNNGKCNF